MYTSSSLVIIASVLAASSYAQNQDATSTMRPVTQISDGQVQAPSSAPVASVSSYVNPYVTQTNSLGVVTGQPLPATSQPLPVTTQPSVVTSMASAATYVSSAPGIPVGINTTLISVASSSSAMAGTSAAGNLSTSTRTQSASRTSGTSGSASSGSSTSQSSAAAATGAAGAIHVAGTGLALGLAGSIFALFL